MTWSIRIDCVLTKCLISILLFVLWMSTIIFYGESFQKVLSHNLKLLPNPIPRSTQQTLHFCHQRPVVSPTHTFIKSSSPNTLKSHYRWPTSPLQMSASNILSSFTFLRCRTSLYENSLIPSLARHLASPKKEVELLSSSSFVRSTPFILIFADFLLLWVPASLLHSRLVYTSSWFFPQFRKTNLDNCTSNLK